MSGIHVTELLVFLVLFAGVAVMGFLAARWKSGDTMEHLDEWGLGGRKFGGWITWFLVGGDLYTAYTFVAVPALVARHAQRIVTNAVLGVASIDQPSARRDRTSSSTAQYTLPSRVGCSVMSVAHS